MSRVLCKIYYKKFIENKYIYNLFSTQLECRTDKSIGKVVSVAIIGAPNSGKSTLINKIVERKVCAASNKVHTTTKLAKAVCTHEDSQIVFLDTPGVITPNEKKKYNLPGSMVDAYKKSLKCADVVGVIHDVTNKISKESLHKNVVSILNTCPEKPSFLILNKVDKLKSKHQLLSIIRNLTNGYIAGKTIPGAEKIARKSYEVKGYSHFSDVFLVSALKGDGVKDLKEYLLSNAKPSKLSFSPDEWTDQKPEDLVEELVRAKFLDFLAQEIPYQLDSRIEYFEEVPEENKILCMVQVECPSERLMKLIAGAGGGRLQQIKSHIRSDLVDLFQKKVSFDVNLMVRNKPSN